MSAAPRAAQLHDRAPRKRATNVSVSVDLLQQARALEINLSQLLERALIEELRNAKRERWLRANQDAIASYNARVTERGVFSDGLRRF